MDFRKESVCCFTSDVDWCSEAAVVYSLKFFEKYNLTPTYFLTHPSQELNNALKSNTIEGGIHPNFLPDSSQGQTFDEVIEYCFELLPQVKCSRSHRYFDVNDINEALYAKGVRYDSNECTFLTENILPYQHRSGIIRFPIFLEDGAYLYHGLAFDIGKIKEKLLSPGIKIINIHPMHLVLNSPTFKYSREIKDSVSREEWNTMDNKVMEKIRFDGEGIENFLIDVIDFVNAQQLKILTLGQLYEIYDEAN